MNGTFSEYVIPDLIKWRSQGKRAALLTLFNVEPTGPRPPGSQMAVSDAGDFTGFLSGGCVEGALVEETRAAIDAGQNKVIRYGVNSPYFDIELPCGSAIDVYIDVGISDDVLAKIAAAMDAREAITQKTDMDTGKNTVFPFRSTDNRLQLILDTPTFDRLYRPPLRLIIAGKGPVVSASAEIATASGMSVHVITTEDDIAARCEAIGATTSKTVDRVSMDAWTAAATLFHEHELEIPVLSAAMQSDAFYIGALGSRSTHSDRVGRLIGEGFADADIDRIHGPLGISIGSRNPPEIAISMIAEVFKIYRETFPA